MTPYRLALANLPFPATPDQSITLAADAIAEAARQDAAILCFPECYVPGYRGLGHVIPPPDPVFLDRAHSTIAKAAAQANIAVILGTERIVDGALRCTALVVNPDGAIAGFQDKVQVDPSEDDTYTPGTERHVFRTGPLTFGVAICHEGWRYPETVRYAARRGARIVFHPHLHEAEPGNERPTFHRHAALCRAAENTCFFATVNYASPGAPTTSAVARPDGTLLAKQPCGVPGLLLADLDLDEATCLLARRLKPA